MILIGLGANLSGPYGSPECALQACKPLFKVLGLPIIKSSHIWASAPVPISDQPWYRNAVCRVETTLGPLELMKALHSIETEFGRVRSERNAPRVLDLDILAYDHRLERHGDLTLPHPRLHDRAFVLYPLQEIAPGWVHPALDKSVDELIKALPKGQEIKRLAMTVIDGDKNDG